MITNVKYSIGGVAPDDLNDSKVYAMTTSDGKHTRYYIKYATSGPDSPHLLNPWGVNFRPDIDDRRFESVLGKKRFEFRTVTKNVFDLYVCFLETQNEMYYRQAERALD